MLGLIKLLYSLSNSLPMLRSILIDLVSFLKEFNASRRKEAKDEIVNSRIDSLLHRMHNDQTRERTKTDGQDRLP